MEIRARYGWCGHSQWPPGASDIVKRYLRLGHLIIATHIVLRSEQAPTALMPPMEYNMKWPPMGSGGSWPLGPGSEVQSVAEAQHVLCRGGPGHWPFDVP